MLGKKQNIVSLWWWRDGEFGMVESAKRITNKNKTFFYGWDCAVLFHSNECNPLIYEFIHIISFMTQWSDHWSINPSVADIHYSSNLSWAPNTGSEWIVKANKGLVSSKKMMMMMIVIIINELLLPLFSNFVQGFRPSKYFSGSHSFP